MKRDVYIQCSSSSITIGLFIWIELAFVFYFEAVEKLEYNGTYVLGLLLEIESLPYFRCPISVYFFSNGIQWPCT